MTEGALKLIDSHCHLDNPKFNDDREATIDRALQAGVETMVAIGTGDGPPDLEAGLRLADRYPFFLATVGVHPHDAFKADGTTWKRLAELLNHPKAIACGEIGLDYHYNLSAPDIQRGVFIDQLRVAADLRKPISIHTREAWEDTLAILEEHWKPSGLGGVMHCFSGGPTEAQRCLDLGFHLSFAGVVTFPKAEALREAAKLVPADRILIETDAPFLAPVPHRGKRNEPAYVAETARKVAEVRCVPVEDLCLQVGRNFRGLFGDVC